MKLRWLIAVALALASVSAFAETYVITPTKTFAYSKIATSPNAGTLSLTQAGNSAAGNKPTTSTPGIPLSNVCSVSVTLAADSAQTLSGAGTLVFHYKSPALGANGAYAENQDVKITVTASGSRYATFAGMSSTAGAGLFYVEARSVTVSSGNVTVYVDTKVCKP